MKPAVRTQVDEQQEFYSLATAMDFKETTDTTRQEFKEDADVNVQLARFGVQVQQRPVTYGEGDYTLDLQGAFTAISEARHAHAKLPQDLRKRYPTWRDLLGAVERGELKAEEHPKDEGKPKGEETPTKPVDGVPPTV